MAPMTRRALLGAAGAVGTGLLVGGYELGRTTDDASADGVVPFHGAHQAGVATPAQDRLHFAAFDVATESRRELRDLLRAWTDAAARMTAGRPAGAGNDDPFSPPDDTGEAFDLGPSRLTLTFGFGPSLFDERFGLAAAKPAKLVDLPPFPGDSLQPDRSGGDLCVQSCANDPQVAFHAVRNLARIARGAAYVRWSQLGFGRTSTTSRAQSTPRNLMGFKDGTNNIKLEDETALREHVWVGDSDQPVWLRGGTYLVARRIRMLIEVWDRASLADQEDTIGRRKVSGAPLGGRDEFDKVQLGKLPLDAHVRLAAPAENADIRILRRGYSFTDGIDERLGQLDAGLFFISFQRDPARQFVPLQQRLAANDALNEYISHTGGGIYAVPPGVQPGATLASTLF
jgi:deferrochelatase/peroxidase EfeB